MKKFKCLFMALVLVTCILGTSTPTSASSYSTGKAVIPSYGQSSGSLVNYYVSNITDNIITVNITLYNADGTIVIDDGNSSTGRIKSLITTLDNYNEQNADSSLTFTLTAHSTGCFQLATTPDVYMGYGIISWMQSGTALKGLVATSRIVTVSNITLFSNQSINGGMPF